MVWIAGGSFVMGDDPHYPEEGPPQTVTVKGFWIDTHEVTNAEFAAFVKATGYKTVAERDPPKLPDAPPEMLVPGSAVFNTPSDSDPRWWRWVPGAQWRHPSGQKESIVGRDNDPVVQIAYQDAEAYAQWMGKALPSEAQWEYAARGGDAAVPEPVDAKGRPQANYYQGVFPIKNLNTDGYGGRAPVGCFKPNRFGLYDMIGNVWEWTSASGMRPDASEPVNVIKGGSYLCAANYCARYRPAARQFQERGLGTDHIGFRLVDTKRNAPAY
jgi:formylglycine-generating enzyme required for sulfatase activity